ncbi:MAG: glutathione S-transferase [Granulosicoccus sp.]|jgi:glutathione S-transferase
MNFTLYTASASIGVVSHIALEESGLPFKVIQVDFASKQQSSVEYREINPKARVPSLIVEEGIITETPAILTYLAQMAPNSSLALPENPFESAQIHSFNAYLCSTAHVAHAHKMRGTRWVDDEASLKAMTANVPKTVALCFDMIEKQMLKGPWVHGSGFTISDPYLYRISTWAESDGVDINNYPKIKAHREAMARRDSVRAVEAYFQSDS